MIILAVFYFVPKHRQPDKVFHRTKFAAVDRLSNWRLSRQRCSNRANSNSIQSGIARGFCKQFGINSRFT